MSVGGESSVLGEMYDAGSPFNGRNAEVGAAGENGAKTGNGEVGSRSPAIEPGGPEASEADLVPGRCDEDPTGMPAVEWCRGS